MRWMLLAVMVVLTGCHARAPKAQPYNHALWMRAVGESIRGEAESLRGIAALDPIQDKAQKRWEEVRNNTRLNGEMLRGLKPEPENLRSARAALVEMQAAANVMAGCFTKDPDSGCPVADSESAEFQQAYEAVEENYRRFDLMVP